MRPAVFTFPAADADGICLSQTTSGAGAVVMNGVLVDKTRINSGVTIVTLPGIQRVVSITSAADLSAVDFTITGTNLLGAAVTETLAGPNATTVSTTAQYHTITSVTADAAVGSAVTLGTGSTGTSGWWTASTYAQPTNIGMAMVITGTIDVTVQNTMDDVQTDASPTAFGHPDMTNLTASAVANYAYPPGAIRMVVNSSSGGAADFTIIQAGM